MFGADGKSLDIEATAKKVAASYVELEKARPSAAPAKAEDYKVNVPEALKASVDVEKLAKDPLLQGFLKDMHAKGASQDAVDVAIAAFADRTARLMGEIRGTPDKCIEELTKTWPTEAERTTAIAKAYAAGKAYGGADFDGILADYGNDPRVIRLLANAGKDLGGDGNTPGNPGALPDADILALQSSPAYWNPKDPQHQIVKAKVEAHYKTKFGDKPHGSGVVTGNALGVR